MPKPWLEFTIHGPGIWGQTFMRAQQLANDLPAGQITNFEAQAMFDRLVNMIVTRDKRIATLVSEYLASSDLVGIMQRMVGTGLNRGKNAWHAPRTRHPAAVAPTMGSNAPKP